MLQGIGRGKIRYPKKGWTEMPPNTTWDTRGHGTTHQDTEQNMVGGGGRTPNVDKQE